MNAVLETTIPQLAPFAKDVMPRTGAIVYSFRSTPTKYRCSLETYVTTVQSGHATSCSCPSRQVFNKSKSCKHMECINAMLASEQALIDRAALAAYYEQEARDRADFVAMFDPCGLGY